MPEIFREPVDAWSTVVWKVTAVLWIRVRKRKTVFGCLRSCPRSRRKLVVLTTPGAEEGLTSDHLEKRFKCKVIPTDGIGEVFEEPSKVRHVTRRLSTSAKPTMMGPIKRDLPC